MDSVHLTAFEHLAPASKDITMRYKSIVFNGRLDYPPIYWGPHSSQVDAAWSKKQVMVCIFVAAQIAARN
jgi:hypothetical protein